MKRLLTLFLASVGFLTSQAQPLAFPSAEGGGRHASGGRGGRVIKVTDLSDDGPGTLRQAVREKGPRTVIFEVAGTIELKSPLVIREGDLTLAGQSAPGDGICIKGYPVRIAADNVIVRYLRFRMGDIAGIVDDALGGRKIRDVIIDHCSCSWSIDECVSFYETERFTLQWCLVSHSLSKSKHEKGAHGFGGIWGGSNATFHHNLLAHHSSRNPRFGSDGFAPVSFRHNVVFNWGFKAAYGGGRHGRIDMTDNYYKPGPATRPEKRSCLIDASEDGTSRCFLARNILEGCDAVTRDNGLGLCENRRDSTLSDRPFTAGAEYDEDAFTAYRRVLGQAGCSHRRDAYDRRVIKEVRQGTFKPYGASFDGGGNGIIDSQDEVGGWPVLRGGKAPKDSDGDGIPDRWERRHGLDPADPADGALRSLSADYTNLEVYLESILPKNR